MCLKLEQLSLCCFQKIPEKHSTAIQSPGLLLAPSGKRAKRLACEYLVLTTGGSHPELGARSGLQGSNSTPCSSESGCSKNRSHWDGEMLLRFTPRHPQHWFLIPSDPAPSLYNFYQVFVPFILLKSNSKIIQPINDH